jgi:RNA polymerase sigma factor (sigma-70 family)
MATSHLSSLLQHLRHAALRHDGRTDGQLLESFITRRDESAFEALVRRHGPMVWGVCRRLLHNDADAEDAFQAAFLVLVKKAASITDRAAVGNWLYGVARNAALKARAMNSRRRTKETQWAETSRPDSSEDAWEHLRPLLDNELSHLHDRYRLAIVLCDLEGLTVKEAAQRLGCPQGTVASRLARGRSLLAKRLARCGLALSGGLLAAVLTQKATGAGILPPTLVTSTIEAAMLTAAGQAVPAELISAKVAALTQGVLKTMFSSRMKLMAVLVLMLGAFGGVVGVLSHQLPAAERSGSQSAAREPRPPEPPRTAILAAVL